MENIGGAMSKRRHELYLIVLVLIIGSVLLLYNTLNLPDDDFSGESQTAVTETKSDSFKSAYAVDINKASKFELLGIKGISEDMADSIIEYRNKYGRFTDISELINVSGIGEKTYEKLKPYITV